MVGHGRHNGPGCFSYYSRWGDTVTASARIRSHHRGMERSGGIFPNQDDSLRISLDLDDYVDVDALILDTFYETLYIFLPKFEISSNQMKHYAAFQEKTYINEIRKLISA